MKEFLSPFSPTMPPLALNCTADMCHRVRKILGEKHLLSRKDGAIHKAYNPMGCFPASVHSLERVNTQAGRQKKEVGLRNFANYHLIFARTRSKMHKEIRKCSHFA